MFTTNLSRSSRPLFSHVKHRRSGDHSASEGCVPTCLQVQDETWTRIKRNVMTCDGVQRLSWCNRSNFHLALICIANSPRSWHVRPRHTRLCMRLLNSHFHRNCRGQNRTLSCSRRCCSDIHWNASSRVRLLRVPSASVMRTATMSARHAFERAARRMPSTIDAQPREPAVTPNFSPALSLVSPESPVMAQLVQVARSRVGLHLLLEFPRLDPIVSHASF